MLLLSLCPLALPGWPVFSFYSIEKEEFGQAFECSEFLRSFLEISQQSSCLPPVHRENFRKKVLKPVQCLHILYVPSLKYDTGNKEKCSKSMLKIPLPK